MLKTLARTAVVVVVGGCVESGEGGCLSSIEILRVDEPDRQFKLVENALTQARRGPAIAKIGEDIVVAGGCARFGRHLKTIELLKIEDENVSSTLDDRQLPEKSSCSAFCSNKESLFIAGGYDGIDCLSSICIVDATSVNKFPSLLMRLKNATAIMNPINPSEVLLIGGWDSNRTLSTVFSLDLNQNKECEMTGLLPYPVEGHTATVIGDEIVLVGGFDEISTIQTMAVYNPELSSTRLLNVKLEIARENHATVYLPDTKELLVIGGWNGTQSLNSVEVFSVELKPLRMERKKPLKLKQARQKAPAVVI